LQYLRGWVRGIGCGVGGGETEIEDKNSKISPKNRPQKVASGTAR